MSITTRVEVHTQTLAVAAQNFTLTTVGTGFTINNITLGRETNYYRHDQPTAASVWVVNHNIGETPNLLVYSVGGARVDAEIIHISSNQTQILFDNPFAGFAICS